jgi:hypothetical protein
MNSEGERRGTTVKLRLPLAHLTASRNEDPLIAAPVSS